MIKWLPRTKRLKFAIKFFFCMHNRFNCRSVRFQSLIYAFKQRIDSLFLQILCFSNVSINIIWHIANSLVFFYWITAVYSIIKIKDYQPLFTAEICSFIFLINLGQIGCFKLRLNLERKGEDLFIFVLLFKFISEIVNHLMKLFR